MIYVFVIFWLAIIQFESLRHIKFWFIIVVLIVAIIQLVLIYNQFLISRLTSLIEVARWIAVYDKSILEVFDNKEKTRGIRKIKLKVNGKPKKKSIHVE